MMSVVWGDVEYVCVCQPGVDDTFRMRGEWNQIMGVLSFVRARAVLHLSWLTLPFDSDRTNEHGMLSKMCFTDKRTPVVAAPPLLHTEYDDFPTLFDTYRIYKEWYHVYLLHFVVVQPSRLILSGSSEEQTVRLYCAQTARLIHSAEMYPGRKHGSLYVQSLR